MPHVALTAVGADRPGIVAALTGVLMDLGCNLEDSTMSMLRGHFAVLLVIDVPDGMGADVVESALTPVAERLHLVVAVRPMGGDSGTLTSAPIGAHDPTNNPESATNNPESAVDPEASVFTFSVHGADRPGIVHRAATALAESGGNIVDLSTRLVGTAAEPVYVLMLTVGFAPGVDAEAAATRVQTEVETFGVQCHAHRVEIDVL